MDGQIIKIGRVVSVDDPNDCGRIKVHINSKADDIRLSINDLTREYVDSLPWAFPLLPKYLHINPKVDEYVLILTIDAGDNNSQRFFIGPILPQLSNLTGSGGIDTLNVLHGSIVNVPGRLGVNTNGALPNPNDVTIFGRKNCEVRVCDDDVKICAGIRNFVTTNSFHINNDVKHSGIIDLRYHNRTQIDKLMRYYESSATIIADRINLIGGTPDYYSLFSNQDGVNSDPEKKNLLPDEEIKKIVDNAHQLPYGDVLLEFLQLFLEAFSKHTHKFVGPGYSPVDNDSFNRLSNFAIGDILSPNVRIN